MAAEAEAGRAARAKVIAADGEMRASKALSDASGVIEKSPAAIQLRHLQVIFNFEDSEQQVLIGQQLPTFHSNWLIWPNGISCSVFMADLDKINCTSNILLQTLNACGVEKNSIVMFPVPMDMYSMYQKTK